MQRIVLYFGSFNPVHYGHIAVARYAADILDAQVWLVVSPRNPLKDDAWLAPGADRLEMARIAVRAAGDERLEVCDVEFSLPCPSYTIDTLRALGERYPEAEFSLLVGGDIPGELHLWKDYKDILAGYDIFVYPRPGEAGPIAEGRIRILEGVPMMDVSSTVIRARLCLEEDCDGMTDDGVLAYIAEKKLYSSVTFNKENGKRKLQKSDFGGALNDFTQASLCDPSDEEARQYIEMIKEILNFRYTDLYNP